LLKIKIGLAQAFAWVELLLYQILQKHKRTLALEITFWACLNLNVSQLIVEAYFWSIDIFFDFSNIYFEKKIATYIFLKMVIINNL